MLENKKWQGIYYSRFIASWVNVDGCKGLFKKWLGHLEINGEHMDEKTISEIDEMYMCGKLELEIDARNWSNELTFQK